MTNHEYQTPNVEILLMEDADIIATSSDPVFLPPDEFGEI